MSKIFLLSLGCDKNRVDGEVMVGALRVAGYEVVNNPEGAQAIIVNTCGFISDAVQESLDAIFELAEHKKANCRALIIVGCMAERYKNEIAEKIPEADAIIGVGEYEKISEVVEKVLAGASLPNEQSLVSDESFDGVRGNLSKNSPEKKFARLAARTDAEASHVAYVKIAEGCDNHCTYCTIPKIRGAYKSRPAEEILEECRLLVEAGAKELVIVAQDTARYGTDIYGEKKLPALLREIAKTGAEWIRLMYVYPEHITPALIDVMADTPQICEYIDMPIQHCDDAILSKMGRKGGKRELEQLIRVLRDRIPGIAIRTTLMVGFPGETEENFRNLLTFVRENKFDRLGAFPYSQEEGTPAAEMPRQIKDDKKQERLSQIMALQQKIHFKAQRDFLGKTLPVIIDAADGDTYTARTRRDAYEVDTLVCLHSTKKLTPGQICSVKITATDDYDLRGVLEE
jgi:ribosomal protein S12 methylthiotransferase